MADLCAKCGERPPGEGGILCPECREAIEKANAERQKREA